MTLICAWCRNVMRVGDPALPVSHGCCETCRDRVLAEAEA